MEEERSVTTGWGQVVLTAHALRERVKRYRETNICERLVEVHRKERKAREEEGGSCP